jgi:hypothetical protein
MTEDAEDQTSTQDEPVVTADDSQPTTYTLPETEETEEE